MATIMRDTIKVPPTTLSTMAITLRGLEDFQMTFALISDVDNPTKVIKRFLFSLLAATLIPLLLRM